MRNTITTLAAMFALVGMVGIILTHVVGFVQYDGYPAVVSHDGIRFERVVLADQPAKHTKAKVCEYHR